MYVCPRRDASEPDGEGEPVGWETVEATSRDLGARWVERVGLGCALAAIVALLVRTYDLIP